MGKRKIKKTPVFTDNTQSLSRVGFAFQTAEPTDAEVYDMVDEVIGQVLGAQGLAAIIKPGDKVVIKVNIVATPFGNRGEKGRGGITDPRIVRYVAEKVRDIIGFDEPADLKVIDATFYTDPNPSLKTEPISFYWARLERNGDNATDNADVCYDGDADGYLDGTSRAQLVNADSLDLARQVYQVKVTSGEEVTMVLPKFLRTREQAEAEGSDEYCDVLISIPVFKSHGIVGITGALKLHYGLRHYQSMEGDLGRYAHGPTEQQFFDYLCAQQLLRKDDLIIMDCLTGNRQGPTHPSHSSYLYLTSDEPIDYILTNAMLASHDPVAIDTVETILAGYDPDSIHLLEHARQNGLGTNQPQWIDLAGYTDFLDHRQRLYNQYTHDQYPFLDNWGGARVRENHLPAFAIQMGTPRLVEEGIYALDYNVVTPYPPELKLARVELLINQKRVAFLNNALLEPGQLLEQGTFMIDLNQLGFSKPSFLTWMIVLWDEGLNCVLSQEVSSVY